MDSIRGKKSRQKKKNYLCPKNHNQRHHIVASQIKYLTFVTFLAFHQIVKQIKMTPNVLKVKNQYCQLAYIIFRQLNREILLYHA
jgi:hypothetical protein